MRLPSALQNDNLDNAVKALTRYYGSPYLENGYTGASFDSWDSTGTRAKDANVFTADDLVAIGFLSVDAGPRAARDLLRDRRAHFQTRLEAVGPDRDLGDVTEPINKEWPAWQLETELCELYGIALTKASKLIARKRPRLYPIWDNVVVDVMETRGSHLVPIRDELRNNSALRGRLREARERADLPDQISEIRVLDVIAWMEGKGA